MSGYGGYQQYSSLWSVNHADANEIVNDYTLKIIKQDGGSANFFSQTKRNPSINCKIKVSGLPLDSNYIIIQYYNSDLSSVDYFKIHNGINNVSLTPSDETQDSIYIYCPVQIGIVKDQPLNVLIEFLPNYPGALVSDGVDDYGSITKPFGNVGTVIFMLDEIKWDDKRFLHNISVDEDGNRLYCWKSNGQVASGLPPTETDIDNYFIIFTRKSQYVGSGWILFGSSASSTISVALYALEIYDRDLTEEEIETVKQRMIKEYEKATGNVMEGVILLEDGTDLLLEDGTSLLME